MMRRATSRCIAGVFGGIAALVLFAPPATLAGAARDSAPRTTIIRHQVDGVTGAASFQFRGSRGHGRLSFECRLDRHAFQRCRSPKRYTRLPIAGHVFEVRARDQDGHRDQTPATFRFRITGPPQPQTQTQPVGAPKDTRTLSVLRAGNGAGSVTSDTGAINCGATCAADYDVGTTVTLTASPAAGSTFAGWSGAGCSGTAQCSVTIDDTKSVTATFTLERHTLTVARDGNSSGTVTSGDGAINCGATCAADYDYGTTVTLTAAPSANSHLVAWSGGGCTGTGACQVSVTAATSVTATFALNSYTLTVMPCSNNCDNTGPGTITSSDGFINCAGHGGPTTTGTCSHIYQHGTMVTLTATVTGAGTVFGGWDLGGPCSGQSAVSCIFTITGDSVVAAFFV